MGHSLMAAPSIAGATGTTGTTGTTGATGLTSTTILANLTGSILLSHLSSADRARMAPQLEACTLHVGDILVENDSAPSHVYFPESGMVSLVATFANGKSIEMASVGREGMVGMCLFYQADHLPERSIVQVAGRALRMRASAFRDSLEHCPSLKDALHRYAGCIYSFAAQNSACVQKHRVTPRLARWLLHAADQSGTANLHLTHSYAATMLGVRRSSVTISAGQLRSQKLIAYTRSAIDIVDRDGLEAAACECYRTITDTYDRLIVR